MFLDMTAPTIRPANCNRAPELRVKPAPKTERLDKTTFEGGRVYSCRSACDHNTVFRYRIVRRTATSAWIERRGEVVRRKISVSPYDNTETIYPEGTYSMCPVLKADRGDTA